MTITIGQRIKSAIALRGRSQREVAEAIGLSANGLSRITRGVTEDPACSIILNLAQELNVTSDYLLGLSNNIEPPLDRSKREHTVTASG